MATKIVPILFQGYGSEQGDDYLDDYRPSVGTEPNQSTEKDNGT